MVTISLDISHVPSKKVDFLLEKVPFLSEVITGISYDNTNKKIHVTTSLNNSDSPKVKEIYESFEKLNKSIENLRVIKSKVIKSNENKEEKKAVIKSDNQKKSFVNETEIILMDMLDKLFIKIAKKYGAELREYPTILSQNNMNRNQYHINFPQNIYGVTSVPHNLNVIQEFRQNSLTNNFSNSFNFQGEFLQPCICYHCYEENQGQLLTSNKVLTGKGKCFRNEIHWKKDQFRQNEFLMREIVFMGNEQWVIQIRDLIMEDVWKSFESIGFIGKIATATDPFFFSQDMSAKGTFQMMSNAKYELIVTTKNGKESSIASFNYCQDMLCNKYDIKDDDENSLYSGCVAFGIDRWKEAFIDLYSYDTANWPEISMDWEEILV
ncbi:hypothetical protein B4102_3277 [Heyndrickxia sporothermodurans]|uniref:Aminoacyl-transfer RNA synthetases class-II family profile domain-containing protein n=1 Tax=Heyndrickxia sporothermodurans TaxID=46224 RepID=A0A150KWE4_9BACI|nr:hypothetical protein [Heyndrickxia sporothermodurans]KYD04431.1 hypothetical protein B4102_3277 [Heyndrickxia sporothermodurans]